MNTILLKSSVLLAALVALLLVGGGALAAPLSNIEATSMELKSKNRSGRSTFDYIYQVTFRNNGSTANNVVGVVSSNATAIQLVDNSVNIGELPANASVTGEDTITLRIDRRTPFDPTVLSWIFDGNLSAGEGPPVDDDESVSAGSVSTLLKEGELYPVGTDVLFAVSGAQFSLGENEVSLLRNESLVKNLAVDAGSIIAPGLLVDGVNNVVLYANDNGGNQLTFSITLWAGANSAYISVLNEFGQSVTANLKLRLADDETVGLDAVAEGGVYNAVNLPSRTVIIEATTSSNEFGSGALIGGSDPTITITVKGMSEASEIDNNDFSQGLSGWTIDGAGSVTVVPETN